MFGEGAVVAIGGILKAEILIDLNQRLLMTDAAGPLIGRLGGAEEPDGAAPDLVVGGGVAELAIGVESHALLVEGERHKVVGGEFERLRAAEERDAGGRGVRCESVMERPERVLELVQEFGERLEGKWVRQREAAVLGPCLDERGKRAHPPVRMICGTLAVGFPRDRATVGGFETRAAFPPCVPQTTQVFAGVWRRLFVEIGREKSGGTEKHRLRGIALALEQSERRALGEQLHGK